MAKQQKTRPQKRVEMSEAQLELARATRAQESRDRRDREKREAIQAAKEAAHAKAQADLQARYDAGDDDVEDFGGEGVFDEDGTRVVLTRKPKVTMPQFELVPVAGEVVDPAVQPDYKQPITDDQRAVFLNQLATWGQPGTAAWNAGTTQTTVQTMRRLDALFAAQWKEAMDAFLSSIDQAVIRRGRDGWQEPIFSPTMGCQIGTKIVYDSALLQMAAKRLLPERYGEHVTTTHEVKGVLVIDDKRYTAQEWADEYAEAITNEPPVTGGS